MLGPHPLLELLSVTAGLTYHHLAGGPRKVNLFGKNQLDTLGLLVNIIVLWQTVCTQAALDHLEAAGHDLDPADVARLSPLGHPTINLDGRYRSTIHPPTAGLRPLRINP